MSQDNLIAEIADDKIRYIIYKHNEKSNYEILSKKILRNKNLNRMELVKHIFSQQSTMKLIKMNKKLLRARSVRSQL